jgi:hypothetical protein
MRMAFLLVASAALTCGALPVPVQSQQGQFRNPAQTATPGPTVGQLEIKAYQPIPKTKIAVQLTSDTHLSRELRREVMIRVSKRGNEVGFSGGNVMRMDVSYYDLSSGNSGGPNAGNDSTPGYESPGSNPKPQLLGQLPLRENGPYADQKMPVASTLRIVLTLYSVDSGKVLWVASVSCNVEAARALQAGEAMIDNIFNDADKNRVGDAGCPL